MRARYPLLTFSIFGGLVLACVYASPQQPTTGQKKSTISRPSGPTMPEQQLQFCAAFRELETWHNAYESQFRAAGNNPIQLAQIQKEKPDFARLLEGRTFAVMGDGAFQNWVGNLILTVRHDPGSGRDAAYVEVRFPCVWATFGDPGDLIGNLLATPTQESKQTREYLSIGNGFERPWNAGGSVYRGVAIDSPAGKALAGLTQGEAVTVSGKLNCAPPAVNKKGGCETANGVRPEAIVATISSIASIKTRAVVRLAEDPPIISDFERVRALALQKNPFTFSLSDRRETLKDKARALVWRNTKPASVDLLEFVFSPERCRGCSEADTFVGIGLDGYDLDPEGKIVRRQRPCSIEKDQKSFCMDEIVAFAEGDIPAVRDVGTINTSPFYVPGPNGLCYVVKQEEQAALLHRSQKINDFLQHLGLRLEPNAAARKMPNPCDPLNSKVTAERTEIRNSVEHREASLTTALITITAGEFRRKLAEAVNNRALKLGADPSQYAGIVKSVADAVELCASIPEADFAASMNRLGMYALGSYKGGMYRDCVPTGVFRTMPETRDQPGLAIRHDITEKWDPVQKRWPSVKFRISVFLKALPSYKSAASSGSAMLNEYEAEYMALAADILNPRSSAAAKFICPGTSLKPLTLDFTRPTPDLVINTPTTITKFHTGGGSLSIEIEGHTDRYIIPAAVVKDSCPGFAPPAPSGGSAPLPARAPTPAGGSPDPGISVPPTLSTANGPDEHTLKLTTSSPAAERDATIAAPGDGNHSYNVYFIDARDFTNGGTLVIEIQTGRNNATPGSFDLFPSNIPIPTKGTPKGSLAGIYNMPKGLADRIVYRFRTGQVFAFGLEGAWVVPKGASGQVHFRATVRR